MDRMDSTDLYYESIKDLRKFVLKREFKKHQGICQICSISYHAYNMLKCEGCKDLVVCKECAKRIERYHCSKSKSQAIRSKKTNLP